MQADSKRDGTNKGTASDTAARSATLLRAADVAERLGISLRQAYEVMRRELPTISVTSGNGGRRVHSDDLDAWIAAKREQAKAKLTAEQQGQEAVAAFEAYRRQKRA